MLLVTFDTTRADHIGCYGDELARTPTVTPSRAKGLVRAGDECSSDHAALAQHLDDRQGPVSCTESETTASSCWGEEQETLAELLAADGYRTAAAVGSYPLLGKFGIGQGFELFDDHITGDYEDRTAIVCFPKIACSSTSDLLGR